jgi:DNA-directed RNA polymerase
MSTLQDQDLDRSFERLDRSEKYRAEEMGYGGTRQVAALTKKYLPELVANIKKDRATSRDKNLWRALRGLSDALAIRLITAGASVAGSDRLGCARNGHKSFQATALWISRQLAPKCQDQELQAKIGVWGIEMLLGLSGPAFELQHDDILVLNADLNDFMDEVYVRELRTNGLLSPMLEPPVPWTQVNKGGLPKDHWARPSLVSGHHHKVEAAVRYAISKGKMRRPLEALNHLQSPAWIINERLLAFMKWVRREPVERPAPGEIFWKWSAKDQWREWQQEEAWKADLVAADALVGHHFWTPLHFDFRGRITPIPHFNFQRADHIRALFLFADPEPIGENGLEWLKVHLAARADGVSWSIKPSKLNRAGRIAWVDANRPLLRKIGRAVLDGADPKSIWWALPEDDEPYQFLAACMELEEALDRPTYPTRLPLVFDASCSGLQHFSGMLRSDEGRKVNLTPETSGYQLAVTLKDGETIDAVVDPAGPNDFYGIVAAALWRKLYREVPALCDLMEGPLDRKIVKQAVMSYFYGVTRIGMSEQILEIIKKRNKKRKKFGEKEIPTRAHVFSFYEENGITYGRFEDKFKLYEVNGITYGRFEEKFLPYVLAERLYESIAENAPKAAAAMKFLQELVEIAAKHNKSIGCNTSLSWPLINAYYKPDTKRIEGRQLRRSFVIGDKDDVDLKDAKDAIAANFIHAADAAHLQLVALAARREGIPMMSIHDCYVTIAPRAGRLNEIARDQFIRLHRHNLLNDIREATRLNLPKTVQLPKPPPIGNGELEQVAQSFFFVS